MLLLCDWESFFLRDVRDLPLKPWKGGSIPLDVSPGLSRAKAWVQSQQGLDEEVNRGAQAYQAWLGYYNGLQRKIGAFYPKSGMGLAHCCYGCLESCAPAA
jgi:hypothetical protein